MNANTEQRKLAAIMFTDMVGYSALSQRDDKLALELLEEHRQLLREIFPRFNGTEIKTIGDAFLIEFNSALEAAQCAIEIQRTLAKRNHDVTSDRRIELKIGIHIGDVVHREGDVYGDGVNIASRIEPLAGAGGICVSMDVERQIRNALEARFEKLALTELKNISVPMDLFRIVLPWENKSEVRGQKSEVRKQDLVPASRRFALIGGLVLLLIIGIGWWWTSRPHKNLASTTPESKHPQNVSEKSIAVLPFENLSSDKENAYFAEGIQDEILTRLSKIADLKVISRTSTQHFKSTPDNLPQIAKQLGVAHIVEGSVQKANDQVRVNVQLINALTDAHLWADTYDRKLTDIFAVESEIAKTIAETLQAKLTSSEKASIAKTPTVNPDAYELYLKGRFFWNKRTGDDLRKSIEYLKQAVAKDPGYALAYAGLADSYGLLRFYGGASPAESVVPAAAAAEKALELDDSLAEPHASLGLIATEELEVHRGVSELERAVQLNPNYATAHHWLALAFTALGQSDRAIKELKRALELDPLSMAINADLSIGYLYARRYDEGEAQARKALEIDPRSFLARYYLGMALQLKGQLKEAIPEFQKAVELNHDPYCIAMLVQGYARNGQPDEARKLLAQLNEMAKSVEVPEYALALAYTSLGEKDRAIAALEHGFAGGNKSYLFLLPGDPLLDDLRGDPRFEALVQKIVAPKTH
jgi:adenylate cyclase